VPHCPRTVDLEANPIEQQPQKARPDMNTLTDWLRLAFRACLSATLMIEAIVCLMPGWNIAGIEAVTLGISDMFYQNVAFAVLYFIMSIWLLFGIKTQVVAALAGILLVLPAMVIQGVGSDALATKLALAAVFALPLSVFGGGRFSIYDRHDRAGWITAL
jgi:uncharacterized membrane protein YphA (DoxX/SURF4 family)